MKALPLVGIRNGKLTPHWPAILARIAAYFVMVGLVVALVTWISDVILGKYELANIARLLLIPGFLAVLFVIHDLRRDLKRPSSALSDSDGKERTRQE